MNEKQKQAITILNILRDKNQINIDEYFLLLEFVVQSPQLTQYIPYYLPATPPTTIDPIYDNHVYCKTKAMEEL